MIIAPDFTEAVTLNDCSAETLSAVWHYDRMAGKLSLLRRGEKIRFAWLIGENLSLCDFINSLGDIDMLNDSGEYPMNLYSFCAAYNVKFPPETVRLMRGNTSELDDISDLSELLSAVLCNKGDCHIMMTPGHVDISELQKLRVRLLQQFIFLRMYIPIIIEGQQVTQRERLSVFGTKKAGKSTLLNALLGGEYSPASPELPTPCRMIYSEGIGAIVIEREGKVSFFSRPEDMRNFLREDFRVSQSSRDIHAYIPKFPESLHGFTITDTPGPNLAGNKAHYDAALSEIGGGGMSLFVMNYSSHLTDDEISLLSKVYDARESTLIIALNKIDEMYSSEVVKSYERAADYIASRLNALGYEDFVIVPVSALTAVCAREMGEIIGCRGKFKGDLREKFRGTDKSVMASFTANILDNIRDFHGLEIKYPASLEETGRVSYLQSLISSECRLNPAQV